MIKLSRQKTQNKHRRNPDKKTIMVWLTEEDYLKFRQLAYFHNRTLTNEGLFWLLQHLENVKKSKV